MPKRMLLPLLILFFSCRDENVDTLKNIKSNIEIDKEAYEMIGNAKGFSELFTLNNTIQLESNDECIIGEIESVIYLKKENKIIVLDSDITKEVYIFNLEGEYLNKIGKRGSGPGEYLKPMKIAYENGVLVVYADNNKFLLFTLNGTLLREEVIKEGRIYRYMQRIILFKGDLFCYTVGVGFDRMNSSEECRIFKFKDCKYFEKSFAIEPEKSFDFDFGDMTLMNNSIVFSSFFNGKIYQIDSKQNNVKLLTDLGELSDVNKINSKKNPMQYIMKNMHEIDAVMRLKAIRNFVFIERMQGISVVSPAGKVVAKNLKQDYNLPIGFEGYSMRRGFEFYDDGIIYATTAIKNISQVEVPNPSLLIYQIYSR